MNHRLLRSNRRGNSSIIVVVLGLVIVVTIISNIVLWSYEMNNLDWEKMKEDINIESVVSINETSSFNPSGCSFGGATSLVSGVITDLTSDDGVYMTFRSYSSGTDTSDYADNNTSDEDVSGDKGTHSDFAAQQTGPDEIHDILIEQNTGILNTTLLNDSFEDVDWDAKWDSLAHNWLKDNTQVHGGSASAGAKILNEGLFACDNLDATGANALYVDFWYRKDGTELTDFTLYYYDGSSYDLVDELDDNGGDGTWLHYTEKIVDNQYFISNFRIRFDATLLGGEFVWIDDVLIKKETGTANYELDLEIQWTNIDYDGDLEELSIYGGTMSSENMRVDVWNGTAWQNLFSNLTIGWNNVSVSSYLTTSNFSVRFKGSNEIEDGTQDTWEIDATLLHVWANQHTSEVEFTSLSKTNYWNQLNWTIGSAWTLGSVNVRLQVYDYKLDDYPTSGDGCIEYTSNNTPNTDENKNQIITINPARFRNSTGFWKMKISGVKTTDTQFDLKADWITIEIETMGTRFTFENEESLTVHLVSLWILDSTNHRRYDISVFVNAAATKNYTRNDISLPNVPYTVKVVTERGNTAVYTIG